MIVTFTKFSKLAGCSAPNITQAYNRGVLKNCIVWKGKRKFIDVEKACDEIDQKTDNTYGSKKINTAEIRARCGMESEEVEGGGGGVENVEGQVKPKKGLIDWRREETKWKAGRAKIQYDISAGSVVDKEETKKWVLAVAKLLHDGAFQMIPRITSDLAHMTDEHDISELLTNEFTDLLQRYADQCQRFG